MTTLRTVGHRIGGAAATPSSTRTAPVYDPATGEPQAEVLLAEAADVDTAVQAAKKAWIEWRNVSLARRSRIMFAFRTLLEQRQDELVRIVSAEHGKVLEDAKGEVIRGMEVV